MMGAPGDGLRPVASGFGASFFEHAVETPDNELVFVPADAVAEYVAANDLQRADGAFPRDEATVEAHVAEHGPHLTVTSRFRRRWLGLVPHTVAREHTFDLTRLQAAVSYLESDRDALARATYWIPTDEPAPMVVELPHSPPALVSLVEHGELGHEDAVEDDAFQRPCGCVMPPVIEV